MPFTRSTVAVTGNTTSGNTSVTGVTNVATLYTGLAVYGPAIQADTVISSISGTTITLSKPCTATATGSAITGQYITQTGTDADPSGLASIAGVATITQGSGILRRTVYDLGTNQLRIQGTLTHDPDLFEIVSNVQNGIKLETGGTWNYGIARTANSQTVYSKGTGLVFTYNGALASQFGLWINGGTFNWNGGVIKSSAPPYYDAGTWTSNSYNSIWQNANAALDHQIRCMVAPTFNSITLTGITYGVLQFLNGGFNSASIKYENTAYQTPGGGGVTRTLLNPVLTGNQSTADIRLNQLTGTQQVTIVKNPDRFPVVARLNNGAKGDIPVVESLTLSVSNSNNAAAANVVGYIRDTDNGARVNSTVSTYTTDRVYVAQSNAAGLLAMGDILTMVATDVASSQTAINYDYRSNFGNASADFRVYLGGYEYLPSVTRQTLLGNGGRSVLWTMFDDTNITLTRAEATAVLAKISIDPVAKVITVNAGQTLFLKELYHAAKLYKHTGTADAFEVPTAAALLVSASGTVLSLYTGWDLVIGTGAQVLRDNQFNELRLLGDGRVTNNGAVDFPFSDTDGYRASITGLDPEAFGVTWYLRYRKGAFGAWVYLTGTGDSTQILVEQDVYTLQARAPGYEWRIADLDTSERLSLSLDLSPHQSEAGTPQYLEPFDAALEAIFDFDVTASAVAVNNTTAAILQPGFAEVYRATQRIMHLPDLVWTWVNPIKANSTTQKIIIPTGNPVSMFLTDASTASVKLTCPVIHEDTQASADDRVKGNADGFSIILGSPATAESAGLITQIVSMLGGESYDKATHSQAALQALTEQVRVLAQAIQTKTDTLPAQPAAAGDAMTLTAAYDAAKTAATQASVDQVGQMVDGISVNTALIPATV